jgi:hypothetical protein
MVPIVLLYFGTTRPLLSLSSAATLEITCYMCHPAQPAAHGFLASKYGTIYPEFKMTEEISKPLDRSRSYQIEAPLQFRIRGERIWHHGVSSNMSETEIQFKTEAKVSHGAQFEARLTLPFRSSQHGQTSVTFQAVIVRCDADGICEARIFARRLCRLNMAMSPSSRRSVAASPRGADKDSFGGAIGPA